MSDQKQMVRLIGAQENLRKFARNWKHRVKWMYVNTETGQVRGDNKINMFTVRNQVAERLCFHRRLSFCLRRGVYPSMHWGRHPPPGQTYPSMHWADPPPDGHCSGRYASYWNAFLLKMCLYFLLYVLCQTGFRNISSVAIVCRVNDMFFFMRAVAY